MDAAVWRGLIGQLDPPVIPGSLDLRPYAVALSSAEAPATVPTRLWRLARRNLAHGIFEVVPGVYQVRGCDLANISANARSRSPGSSESEDSLSPFSRSVGREAVIRRS
jgi:alkyl sulfatase BDS1-like metallo-beta-lactamase superfamily hydrolase